MQQSEQAAVLAQKFWGGGIAPPFYPFSET